LFLYKQVVSKNISIQQEKRSNPEQRWVALSPFEKALYNNDANTWWGLLQQNLTDLQEEKAILLKIQLEKEAILRLKLQLKPPCKQLLSSVSLLIPLSYIILSSD
jgi:hypothetical protein